LDIGSGEVSSDIDNRTDTANNNSIEIRAVYTRGAVFDGNFTAAHLKQRNPADDVWLTDGEGMMTRRRAYHAHLDIAMEIREVCILCSAHPSLNLMALQASTCNVHRAAEDKSVTHSGCDATGLGAGACHRHGCYIPTSVVDFQKGERQMNMDYSVCQSLKHMNLNGIMDVMLIYDIMCQYHRNLTRRVDQSPYLEIPDGLHISKAIGLFHIHGHQDECFPRFAPTFIKGAGQVDGEILETLWAVLNDISPSTRTATLAHRTEILDDHMNDSNWKKLVRIGR
jgi:hypothetical protein